MPSMETRLNGMIDARARSRVTGVWVPPKGCCIVSAKPRLQPNLKRSETNETKRRQMDTVGMELSRDTLASRLLRSLLPSGAARNGADGGGYRQQSPGGFNVARKKVQKDSPKPEIPAKAPKAEIKAEDVVIVERPTIPTYQRAAALDALIAQMPEALKAQGSTIQLPPTVVERAKTMLDSEDKLLTWADAAGMVLGAPNDSMLLALDAALESAVKAEAARIQAEKARQEAMERAKAMQAMGERVKALTDSATMGELLAIADELKEMGAFIAIHGGNDGQGRGLFIRQMGSGSTPRKDSTPRDGEAKHEYHDDTKGIKIQIPLARYIRETYPDSNTVRMESELKARRDAGLTKTRLSAWAQYEAGVKAGDTFVIRQVAVQ